MNRKLDDVEAGRAFAFKPSPVEFSAALDPAVTQLVRTAAAGDNCAAALADYGRLPPAVLVAGAQTALAGCRAASLAALHAHGLGANEVLQAVSALDLSATFAAASPGV